MAILGNISNDKKFNNMIPRARSEDFKTKFLRILIGWKISVANDNS